MTMEETPQARYDRLLAHVLQEGKQLAGMETWAASPEEWAVRLDRYQEALAEVRRLGEQLGRPTAEEVDPEIADFQKDWGAWGEVMATPADQLPPVSERTVTETLARIAEIRARRAPTPKCREGPGMCRAERAFGYRTRPQNSETDTSG